MVRFNGQFIILACVFPLCSPAVSGDAEPQPIKVGILYSLTGTMGISERSLVDASLMAIDEINKQGGLLGRKILPIIEDGASDWPTFAEKAEKLIREDNVSSVFGCWTSASRKAVLPIFEKYNHLLCIPCNMKDAKVLPISSTPEPRQISRSFPPSNGA